MNLSSYLQMPPAPSGPASNSIPALQSVQAGAGIATGAGLGVDFGQIMARQMQRLVPQQRQSLAADTSQSTEHTANAQDNQPVHVDRQTPDPDPREPRHVRAESSHSETHTRTKPRPAARSTEPAAADATAAMTATQLAPLVVTAPSKVTIKQVESETAAQGHATTPLQTIELSPQVRIITDPQKAPSPESLAAFAKSMGLDESTIQNLLGEAASGTPTATAMTSTQATAANPLLLQTPMGDSTNGAGHADMPTLESLMVMQRSTDPAQPAMPVSGAGLALSASTLNAPAMPGLSAADMASIQQLQITVLPAAVLPMHANVNPSDITSTIDMLSLLSASGVDEKEVSALLSQFSDSTDSNANQNPDQSPSDSNNASSFSQALTRNTQTAHAANASATSSTSANMSEVYDQLSDKMTTELAARMHKQLSDGEWKMKFALRPSNLGGVEIQLEMKDGKLDAVFRADNPLTRDLLQNSSQRLRDALGNFGINAGQVQVGQGGGNAQHSGSGHSTKQGQVRDNSTSQVNGTDSASSATSARNKANASLLDLYA